MLGGLLCDRTLRPQLLFVHIALPHRVNEVRVWRRAAGSAREVTGDLSAVIGGVHQHVRDDVFCHAAKSFALGIRIRNFFFQFGGSECIQILLPLASVFGALAISFVERPFGPDDGIGGGFQGEPARRPRSR